MPILNIRYLNKDRRTWTKFVCKKINVIVGDNNSGKTYVLENIAANNNENDDFIITREKKITPTYLLHNGICNENTLPDPKTSLLSFNWRCTKAILSFVSTMLNIKFEFSDFGKVRYFINDSEELSYEQLPNNIKRVLHFIINLIKRNPYILCIDDVELHMDVQTQKRFIKALLEFLVRINQLMVQIWRS